MGWSLTKPVCVIWFPVEQSNLGGCYYTQPASVVETLVPESVPSRFHKECSMKSPPNASPEIRYLAIDLHKHYTAIGGVNIQQKVILSPRRVEIDEMEA